MCGLSILQDEIHAFPQYSGLQVIRSICRSRSQILARGDQNILELRLENCRWNLFFVVFEILPAKFGTFLRQPLEGNP